MAARATRTATASAMSETFVVMTRCSTGMIHGAFAAGDARSHARTASGESVAASSANGRQEGERMARSLGALVCRAPGQSRDARQQGLDVEGFRHGRDRMDARGLLLNIV